MVSRRLAPIVLAAAVLFAGACGSSRAALSGDGWSVSHAELEEGLAYWGGNQTLVDLLAAQDPEARLVVGTGDGTFNRGFVNRYINFRIQLEATSAEFERRGLEITDEEVEELRAQMPPLLLEAFPDGGRDFVRQVARFNEVIGPDPPTQELVDLLYSKVTVDPRYGSFEPTQGVISPRASWGSPNPFG